MMATFLHDESFNIASNNEELYALSLPVIPGSDSCSKALFRTDAIKDIVISSVVGGGICGLAYHNGPTEHNDNKRSDITYYPHDNTKSLAPVIVEIQNKVSHKFIARLMRYLLNAFDEINILPIVLVINIDGFSSKTFAKKIFLKMIITLTIHSPVRFGQSKCRFTMLIQLHLQYKLQCQK